MYQTEIRYPQSRQSSSSLLREKIINALGKQSNTLAIPIPQTDDELWDITYQITGIKIPRKKICSDHDAPFTAFADAFFARSPISVWYASRGFGGKSVLLAVLGMIEAVIYGASVNLLGGSGEQAGRVHTYMRGDDPNMHDKFWGWITAPRHLLASEITMKETRLTNNGRIRVLMASQKSVRGPHPQRLRLDEVDEMDIKIFDAAMGQPMEARGIKSQTVCSSTWQNPDGTMTEVLDRAKRRGWPVYTWCYKETSHGWLSNSMIEEKKTVVTNKTWEVEYELTEPSSEGRAIVTESVEAMFDIRLGEFDGDEGHYIRIERPILDQYNANGFLVREGGRYYVGCDWAKEQDWTIIWVLRADVKPMRFVAFLRLGRRKWPKMINRFNKICAEWNHAEAAHDATGLGNVIHDLIVDETGAVPLVLRGDFRKRLISNYIVGIESGKIVAPRIDFAYNEHKYMQRKDIDGNGHLPDTVSAGMAAFAIADNGGWAQGASE